jgi:putative phosphoribosyl transferase
MFTDRYDAAKQLVKKLEKYKNKNAIIIAIPRGGVPLGHYIAKTLGLPLEISLSKK